MRLLPGAALGLTIAASGAYAQVGHRSVGCVMNGQDVPQCVCDGTCAGGSQPSRGPAGPQVSDQAIQAMQGAVQDETRRALGDMVQQLGAAQRARTLQQQALEREREQQAGVKAMSAVHGLPGARPARPPSTASAAKRQSAALDCAMSEIFEAADGLGADGERFTRALAEDAKRAKAALAAPAPAPAPKGGSDAYEVARFSRDSAKEGPGGGKQMVVDVVITRDRKTGQTRLNAIYSMSGAGQEEQTGQSTLVLGPSGSVLCQEVSPSAAQCMARVDPAAGDPAYCPSPPKQAVERR